MDGLLIVTFNRYCGECVSTHRQERFTLPHMACKTNLTNNCS
jgi:hypothetical protein